MARARFGAARRVLFAPQAPARVVRDRSALPRHTRPRLQAGRVFPENRRRESTLSPPTCDPCRLLSRLVDKVRWLASDRPQLAPGRARAGRSPVRSAPKAATTNQESKELPSLLFHS